MCKRAMVMVLAMLCGCLAMGAEPAVAQTVPLASGPASGASAPVPPPAATKSGAFEQGLDAYDQGRFDLAYALWLPLAEQGRVAAQFNVANLLEQGNGIAQNLAEAGRWYSKAAEQGDLASVMKVAAMYETGTGLPADTEKARFWYHMAAANTGKDAASVDAAKLAQSRLKKLPEEAEPGKTFPFDGGRFVVVTTNRQECLVALQGTITRAASFVFDTAMEEVTKARCEGTVTLLLESPGGASQEGLVLGRQVRQSKLRTVARYECASSCAAIFLGGTERVLWGARAAIGFHQVRLVRGDQKLEEGRCVVSAQSEESIQMRRYLRFVVPDHADDLFKVFMSTSCNSIEWIHGQAALDMGVATKLEAERVDVFGAKALR